jgi:hypothetical protein
LAELAEPTTRQFAEETATIVDSDCNVECPDAVAAGASHAPASAAPSTTAVNRHMFVDGRTIQLVAQLEYELYPRVGQLQQQ